MENKSWKDNNTLRESYNNPRPDKFEAIVKKLHDNDFEVTSVKKESDYSGVAEISVKGVPLLDKRRLVVDWNTNAGWRHPAAASCLYYNILGSDPSDVEGYHSGPRYWFDQDNEPYEEYRYEITAEMNVVDKISDFIKNNNATLKESKERWVDRGNCTLKEWPELKKELEDKWRKKYKDATAKIIKFGMRGQRYYVVETEEE